MINYTPLTDAEINAYEALVTVAKDHAQPEAEQIINEYEQQEAEKLAARRAIPYDKALSVVHSRLFGNLEPDDVITFQSGETVTVADVLAHPARYDNRACADPCEPDEGNSRAKFYANTNTGKPLINSMLHGGQVYFLGSSAADDFAGYNEESPLPFEELISMAKILAPEDIDELKNILDRSRHLDEIEQQALLTSLKEQTRMPLGTMRKFLQHDQSNSEIDHLYVAKKMVENLGKQNILACEEGVFIWLDKGVWKVMESGELKQRAQRSLEEDRSVMSHFVDGVVSVFKNEIYRPGHKFNIGNPEVINTPSGELHFDRDAEKWSLLSHNRNAYRTSQIPVKYDPGADAPRFRQFLSEIFQEDIDKDDKIRATLEMVGYTMVAHCEYELFILLIGAGANGKSVLLAVLEALIGQENVVGVQPSQFDNRFQRAHLRHKLANIVTEIRQGEVIADAELKGIVSGEPSTVENKFKDPFTMRPYATCWFATNHMPHTRDFSDALFRRALIIKFNRVFEDNEKNPKLRDELIKELPGILNLALGAYGNAIINGFTKPKSSERAKEEWRLEADQVQQFVNECCKRSSCGKIESGKLYTAYRHWAYDNGIRSTFTHKNFRDRLTRLGFGSERNSKARMVTGIDKGVNFPNQNATQW